MFQTTITVHNKVAQKDYIASIRPVLIWAIIAFVSLGFVGSKHTPIAYTATIILLIDFIGIIPTFIICIKRAKRNRSNSVSKRNVIISVSENELYIDNMKIKAIHDEYFKTIDLVESDVPEGKGFSASISEKEVDNFLRFCAESGVIIEETKFEE